MKFIPKIIGVAIIISIAALVLIQVPSVQDRLMASAIKVMTNVANNLPKEDALTAVVCGSRSPIPSPGRAQTCILVKADNKIFIVDIGDGSANNLRRWKIPFNQINTVLLTHLHSDHISDLADLHLATWINENRNEKLHVYGPEGVSLVTKGFEKAYEPDYFFRNQHHGDEIAPLSVAGFKTTTVNLNNPVIYNHGGLKITAFKVVHDPVKPALGYKFEYKGRSMVISGDTAYAKSVIENSKGVDVLFHEAQANHMIEGIEDLALNSGNEGLAKIMADIKTYHTTPIEAAEIANLAEVRQLVFYHLTPAPRNYITEKIFTRGVGAVRKNWFLSEDGTMVIMPVGSDQIILDKIQN